MDRLRAVGKDIPPTNGLIFSPTIMSAYSPSSKGQWHAKGHVRPIVMEQKMIYANLEI